MWAAEGVSALLLFGNAMIWADEGDGIGTRAIPGSGLPFSQGVAVAESRIKTEKLFCNIRWWYEALHDSDYSFSIWIVGPRGVPDGLVVP
jgi:hypothetical protein